MIKKQCLIFDQTRTPKAGGLINPKPVCYIDGNAIAIVIQWPHRGHINDNRSDDGADMSFRHNLIVCQNNVLCYFNQVGALPKLNYLNRIAVVFMAASYRVYFMRLSLAYVQHGIKVYVVL